MRQVLFWQRKQPFCLFAERGRKYNLKEKLAEFFRKLFVHLTVYAHDTPESGYRVACECFQICFVDVFHRCASAEVGVFYDCPAGSLNSLISSSVAWISTMLLKESSFP